MSADRIIIEGLQVAARIGVTEQERSHPQNLILDIELERDLSAAAASDDLSDTVDYDRLTSYVAELTRTSNSKLLEHLAGSIAKDVCSLSGVERVTVEVRKESPPVSEEVGKIAVRITRP
jgi:7,8-dihydroneopterin aldolase/epimerase/oxygenase